MSMDTWCIVLMEGRLLGTRKRSVHLSGQGRLLDRHLRQQANRSVPAQRDSRPVPRSIDASSYSSDAKGLSYYRATTPTVGQTSSRVRCHRSCNRAFGTCYAWNQLQRYFPSVHGGPCMAPGQITCRTSRKDLSHYPGMDDGTAERLWDRPIAARSVACRQKVCPIVATIGRCLVLLSGRKRSVLLSRHDSDSWTDLFAGTMSPILQ